MSDLRQTVGSLDGSGRRIGIVASRFNGRLVSSLIDGAVDCLTRQDVAPSDIHLVRVPGAWELPLALEELAQSGNYDGLIALGLVLRGETPHFDYICAQSSAGIERLSRHHRIPIGFGLLTCDTTEQAEARCGGEAGNKGWEAAEAALEMVNLLGQLNG